MAGQECRIESDTVDPVKIPKGALWGPQTERSYNNFPSGELMSLQIIRTFLHLKKTAARSNIEVGDESEEEGKAVEGAIEYLLALSDEDLCKDFPPHALQTDSDTRSDMNVNKVVANLANKLHPGLNILPDDDVNRGQSSDGTHPASMNIVAVEAIDRLEPTVEHLISELGEKQNKCQRTAKVGRTHLQGATPLTFDQEVSGYISALKYDLEYTRQLEPILYELAIGGTAVDAGLNATPSMTERIAGKLSEVYGHEFKVDTNEFWGLAHHSGINIMHGTLKTLTADMLKIAQDTRFLTPGPGAGYDELNILANGPGSSIVPSKVNPTQAEAVTVAAAKAFGNDATITFTASQGNFEMNAYKTVMIAAFLDSCNILAGTITGSIDRMIRGLTVNADRMGDLLENSSMTVTILSPHIGHHRAATIAQTTDKEGTTLREAALRSRKITEEQHNEWMGLLKVTNVDRSKSEDQLKESS